MEAAAHLQAHGAAALRLHAAGKGVRLFAGAGDHGLPRAVVIHRVDLRKFPGQRFHAGRIELEHREHRARVRLGALVHQLGAPDHQAERVLHGQHAAEGDASQLAQREARQERGNQPRFLGGGGAGHIHGEHAGLGVRRLAELLRAAGKAHFQRAGADGLQRIEKRARRGRMFIEGAAHAGLLRALPGQQKRYASHFGASASSFSASANISWMISAAGCSFFTSAAIWPAMNVPVSKSPSMAARRSAPAP